MVPVFFLFGETHYVVRGAEVEYHELVTLVIVSEGIVVRAKFFPLHVLFVDAGQSQQFNHLRCVYYLRADLAALPGVLLEPGPELLQVHTCATALVENLPVAYRCVQRQPTVFYGLRFLVRLKHCHGFAHHQVLLFLFSKGVVEN